MSVRLSFGRFLIKLGKFVESLAISFMRSDDLMEFNQSANSTTKALFMFADPDWVNSGLRVEEKELLKQVPVQNGNLLLFGLEGGRKALIFDKAGFKVSGIDSVAKNVELALKNTKKIQFNEHLSILIMEELIRERVFSNEKVDIITKRASIRAKKQE